MASATAPVVYWCHQCNVETRPVGDDVLCTFCKQGFIEELHSTEVEPGVAFSTLPRAFSSLLRRPSPSSVGISRNRSVTESPSSPSSSTPRQQPDQRTPSGQRQMDPQGHRPRILSGQLSGVPSLLEAMMQALEEMNGPFPPVSLSASDNLELPEERTSHGASGHERQESRDTTDDSSHGGESRPQMRGQNQEEGLHFFFPPTLILHGDMPSGFRTLEVFIDHGQGMGPLMMPNHVRDYFLGPDLDRLIQLLAENDPNRYGTPPAAKSEVEKLPKFKVTEEHLESDIAQCAVCKDDFELHAEVRQMPCKHIYHSDCILPWLAEHNSCPICRFELPTDDAEYEARKGQSPPGGLNTDAGVHANTVERQEADVGASRNTQGPGAPYSPREESSDSGDQATRQFTLWGIPAVGFDMARFPTVGLNPFARSEDHSSSAAQSESGQSQDAPREEGTGDVAPVQWLFRLFSSGSLFGRENASSDDQSPERGIERDTANS